MARDCLYCGREFEPAYDTDAYCGTYCQNAWWMSSTAGDEWEAIEPRLRAEWTL